MPGRMMRGEPRGVVAAVLILSLSCPRLAVAASASVTAGDAGASTTPVAVASGIAVLARAGAEQAGWALAKEVYARSSLRPVGIDELRARVLVGEAPAADAPQALRDLADERAGVRGDDGGSRALLRTIASQLNVRALVVVASDATGTPTARVFLADSGAFDAARYEADPSSAPTPSSPVAPPAPSAAAAAPNSNDSGAPVSAPATSDGGMPPAAPIPPSPALHWSGAVTSLERAYGEGGPETHGSILAVSPLPPEVPKHSESHPFYLSPWFWGALGAAALGGAAAYFATRDNTTGTIHLVLEVPK